MLLVIVHFRASKNPQVIRTRHLKALWSASMELSVLQRGEGNGRCRCVGKKLGRVRERNRSKIKMVIYIYIWLYICIFLYIYSMEDLTFVISNSCEDRCLGPVSSKFFTGSIKILPRFLSKQTHVWSGNFTIFHPRTVMKLSAWLPQKRWNCFGDSARARQ